MANKSVFLGGWGDGSDGTYTKLPGTLISQLHADITAGGGYAVDGWLHLPANIRTESTYNDDILINLSDNDTNGIYFYFTYDTDEGGYILWNSDDTKVRDDDDNSVFFHPGGKTVYFALSVYESNAVGPEDTAILYLDQKKSTYTGSGYRIGSTSDYGGLGPFTGLIDKVAVYSSTTGNALTEAQMKIHRGAGRCAALIEQINIGHTYGNILFNNTIEPIYQLNSQSAHVNVLVRL